MFLQRSRSELGYEISGDQDYWLKETHEVSKVLDDKEKNNELTQKKKILENINMDYLEVTLRSNIHNYDIQIHK